MKDESTVQQEIQIQSMHHGCHLMRNNNGAAMDGTGRMIRYGLGNTSPNQQFASSDLIGFTKVTITQEMVGKTVAVFTAVEVKKEAWDIGKKFDERENKQNNFLQFIKLNGGIADFCNKVDSLKDLLRY